MPYAIESAIRQRRKASKGAMIPTRLTRFKKVTTKMLQHGASDLQAKIAAQSRNGKNGHKPKVSVSTPSESGHKHHVSVVIQIGKR